MPQNNIISGAAFRSAAVSLIFYLIILILVGFTIYQITKAAMMQELESQITSEVVLFQEIYQQGGQSALVESIKSLEKQKSPMPRLIGLFDDKSAKLAGNTGLAPDFLGWKTRKFELEIGKPAVKYHAFTQTIDSSTIVVGRHMKLIDSVLKALFWVLISAGVLVCICSLLTGYYASRRVLLKLNRLASTLDKVSKGNTKIRLDIDHSNDQIDRISGQINQHLDQLSSLLNSTRNTAISIAHDLRTPLNRVHLMLQEAKEFDGPKTKRMELIHCVEEELNDVREIFDTILRISRIESNKDQSSFKIISVDSLLADMFDIYEAVVEEASQTLMYNRGTDSSGLINGDEKMLRQMLANLIENAMFYSPAEATITLSAYLSSENSVCIEVGDTGPGIALENREKVLDPFYRLNTSRNQPGNGLGLALVRAITIRHAAKLKLMDNNPGLRVSIHFPASDQKL